MLDFSLFCDYCLKVGAVHVYIGTVGRFYVYIYICEVYVDSSRWIYIGSLAGSCNTNLYVLRFVLFLTSSTSRSIEKFPVNFPLIFQKNIPNILINCSWHSKGIFLIRMDKIFIYIPGIFFWTIWIIPSNIQEYENVEILKYFHGIFQTNIPNIPWNIQRMLIEYSLLLGNISLQHFQYSLVIFAIFWKKNFNCPLNIPWNI